MKMYILFNISKSLSQDYFFCLHGNGIERCPLATARGVKKKKKRERMHTNYHPYSYIKVGKRITILRTR